MIGTRKGAGPRVERLERLAHERPCPGCGRLRPPAGAPAQAIEWARLGVGERRELVGLLRVAAAPVCARCGRAGYDIRKLTYDQKRRVMILLRVLSGRTDLPKGGDGALHGLPRLAPAARSSVASRRAGLESSRGALRSGGPRRTRTPCYYR